MKINMKKLRRDLDNYFGAADFAGFTMAMEELIKIQDCSDEELICIARKNGFNPEKYIE